MELVAPSHLAPTRQELRDCVAAACDGRVGVGKEARRDAPSLSPRDADSRNAGCSRVTRPAATLARGSRMEWALGVVSGCRTPGEPHSVVDHRPRTPHLCEI